MTGQKSPFCAPSILLFNPKLKPGPAGACVLSSPPALCHAREAGTTPGHHGGPPSPTLDASAWSRRNLMGRGPFGAGTATEVCSSSGKNFSSLNQ